MLLPQSILDDHVNRMFTGSDGPEFSRHKVSLTYFLTKKRTVSQEWNQRDIFSPQSKTNVTANMSSMLDMSRQSNNASMTLPGRSRHGGGYGQYPGETFNNFLLLPFSYVSAKISS